MNLILLLGKYDMYIWETVPSIQGFKYIAKQKYDATKYKSNCTGINMFEIEELWQNYEPLTA